MNINEWVSGLSGPTDPVLSLFQEISAAGTKLECFPGKTSPVSGNGGQFATADFYHNEQAWKIYYPARCNAHQLYHELLHVRWRHIEKALSLSAQAGADANTINNISELNNDFDHAHVVPREVATYPEAGQYWANDFDRKFPVGVRMPSDRVGGFQVKLTLLRGWMVLPVALPQSPVTQRYREALDTNGWYSAAEKMTRRVQAVGSDKPAAVGAFREALGLDFPRTELCGYV
ncbi:hypothetical protein [Paraburkholderia hospita]|uniref:hypothetical protein n=1 Tax=Paraburkholderia hospita TaxID=169430 RepID=UPI000B344687|nr:hypothetical protein [Paraburkholderia hospita]OUL86134.1 hypothetical protein CA603_22885 [Paraburkholderia hospita]